MEEKRNYKVILEKKYDKMLEEKKTLFRNHLERKDSEILGFKEQLLESQNETNLILEELE